MDEARRLTGQTSLPILILDGKAIPDSTRIIAALEEAFPGKPLYPRDPSQRVRALELEEFFDEELGPHVRRLGISRLLRHPLYMAHLFDADAPWRSRWTYPPMLFLARSRLAKRVRVDAESLAASQRKVDQAVARIEREIQSSGYLVGNTFSVADLTAAAMLSVAVLPPEFPCLPRMGIPAEIEQALRQFENHPVAHWARDIYRRHRAAAPALAQAAAELETRQPAAVHHLAHR